MKVSSIPKNTAIYAGVVVFLLAVLVVQETVRPHRYAIEFPSLTDQIDRIVFREGSMMVMLTKEGEDWSVGEKAYPGSTETIEETLDSLRAITRLDVVTSRTNYEAYGLSGDDGRTIELREGESVIAKVRIGSTASAGDAVYGLLDDNDEVVFLPRTVGDVFSTNAEDFREHNITSIEEDQIVRVSIDSVMGPSLAFQRQRPGESGDEGSEEDALWALEGDLAVGTVDDAEGGAEGSSSEDGASAEDEDQRIDQGRFEDFFRELAPLTADSFLSEMRTLSNPFATITVIQTSGQTATLEIFPPEGSSYPMRLSGYEYSFALPEWRVRRFFLGQEEYLAAFIEE